MSSASQYFERYKNVRDKHGFNATKFRYVEPLVTSLFQKWFGVEITDIENIPSEKRAIVFGNHSGALPIDGLLLYDGIITQHPKPRRVRYLVTKFLLNKPFVGDCLRGFGCVPPDYETATELLRDEELVLFYPEAEKGTGKIFKNRYKLVDFHAGFVRAALETGSPLIPVITIGGEEVWPVLTNSKPLAKLLKWPYFPVTPLFPLLPFPISTVPLPVKILVCVLPQFKLKYGTEAADDLHLVEQISADLRSDVQSKINDLLALRTGTFQSWDMEAVRAYLKSDEPQFKVSARHIQENL